ncbi:hypothetical protein QNN00_05285 [Bacillus velezensis]|nr:hypothetical protein [Bacillus velezensis]
MKRLLVSLRVWMVFLMNWMAPGNGRYPLGAVYGNQAAYHKKAKRTAGAFSFVSRVRSADLTDETKSARGRLDKTDGCLSAKNCRNGARGSGTFTSYEKEGTIPLNI